MERRITIGTLNHREGENIITCINGEGVMSYYTYEVLSGKQYLLSLSPSPSVSITLLVKCYESKIVVISHEKNIRAEITDSWEYVSDRLYITVKFL
jgi:hypothetical protein